MWEDLFTGAWHSIVFGVVGIALMAAGFVLVDMLTPGKLRELIWMQRNCNASLLLAANQLGIAVIVFVAISRSFADFGEGLASTILFGLIGIGLMGVAFVVLDMLTPGKLGEIICDDQPHPAARVERGLALRGRADRRRLHRLTRRPRLRAAVASILGPLPSPERQGEVRPTADQYGDIQVVPRRTRESRLLAFAGVRRRRRREAVRAASHGSDRGTRSARPRRHARSGHDDEARPDAGGLRERHQIPCGVAGQRVLGAHFEPAAVPS